MSLKRLVLLVFTAGAVALVVLWFRGAFRDPYPEDPSGVYVASSVREFGSLGELAATSSLVVKAKVVDVTPGATTTVDDGSGDSFTSRLITLDVEDVAFATADDAAPEMLRVFDGYWSDGIGFEAQDVPWVKPGQVGYFFLDDVNLSSGYYNLIHPEGRVMLTDSGADPSGTGDLWIELEKAGGSAGVLQDLVAGAAREATLGEAKPVPMMICRPSDPDDEDSEPICEEQR